MIETPKYIALKTDLVKWVREATRAGRTLHIQCLLGGGYYVHWESLRTREHTL